MNHDIIPENISNIITAYRDHFNNYFKNEGTRIESLELSARSYNALKRSRLDYVSDIVDLYPDKFGKYKNIGQKAIEEICKHLEIYISNLYQLIFENINESAENNIDVKSKDDINETSIYELDVLQLINHPLYKDKVKGFFQIYDVKIEDMGLPTRAVNAFKLSGISSLAGILVSYPDNISKLHSVGLKTLDVVRNCIEQYILKIKSIFVGYCTDDYDVLYPDDAIVQMVDMCFEGKGFTGLSYKDIRKSFPEKLDDTRIKKCVGRMIADKKLEYVDYRLYKVYPSIFDAINESLLEKDNKEIIIKKYQGYSLEELGNKQGVTRERIRQRLVKSVKNLRTETLKKYGYELFDEDYYAYLYANYEVTKEMWFDFIGVPDKTFGYLTNSLSKGERSIEEALNDQRIDLNLKFKIQDYLNRNKVLIDDILIEKQRSHIEIYALSKVAHDELSYDKFADLYNELLRNNGIDFDEKLYYTDEVRRTRSNRLSQSMYCLWKQGEKLRYYDIGSRDYTELLEILNLWQYSNIELSTLKFIEDFPDLMEKYDIRDQYELHNLLKKIIDVKDYNDMSFSRQPTIRFGEFDRDQAMYDILEAVSPVSAEELAEYVHMEYGYDKVTVLMTYLKCLKQYYHQGVYTINFKKIPADRVELFKEVLVEDFYYISEIKKMYREMFNGSDVEEINPLSLKSLGFLVLGTYVVQNYESADAYFTHLLTKDDVFDIAVYNKKFSNLGSYYGISRQMRLNYDVLLFEPGKAITMNRLSKFGITKEDIRTFCDDIENFLGDSRYFTINSLKDMGFYSKLDDLGFDDYFYEMLLAADSRYLWQRVFGKTVLRLKSNAFENNISIKSFLISILAEYDCVDIDEFIDDCMEKYRVRIPQRCDVIEAISNTDLYYDRIMNKIYKNKNVYYEEFDD